jgi:hypothetical protein
VCEGGLGEREKRGWDELPRIRREGRAFGIFAERRLNLGIVTQNVAICASSFSVASSKTCSSELQD